MAAETVTENDRSASEPPTPAADGAIGTDPRAPQDRTMGDQAASAEPSGALERTLAVLPKVAAIITAFIAAGQALTSWFTGYWQHKTETELAELKDRSSLAESYLRLLLSKDISDPDRIMLLGALGELRGHPLQPWAKRRYDEYEKQNAELDAARGARVAAATMGRVEGNIAELQARISEYNVSIEMAGDDVEKKKSFYVQLVDASRALAIARGNLGVATAGALGPSSPGSPSSATTVVSLSNVLTTGLLERVFPDAPRANIEKNVPFFKAALQEYGISDPKVVADIISTIAADAPDFGPYEEPVSRFNTSPGGSPFDLYMRKDLGNTQPGDGARYRGRGLLNLTGRASYARYSARLGLGTRLVDTPEDALSSEVEWRIICAFFSDRLPAISKALEAGDLKSARRIVNGGYHGLQSFVDTYNKVLPLLTQTNERSATP
jgi:putative chitinase